MTEEKTPTENFEEYEMYLDGLDIRIFKMSSGEEIIAFVESETKDKIILDNPMKILQTYYAIDRWALESEIEQEKEQLANEYDDIDPDFDEFASRMEVKSERQLKEEQEAASSTHYENDADHQEMQKDYIFAEANRKRIISTEHFVDWTPYAQSSVVTIKSAFVMSEIIPTMFFKHLYLEATNELIDDQDRANREEVEAKSMPEFEGKINVLNFNSEKNMVH